MQAILKKYQLFPKCSIRHLYRAINKPNLHYNINAIYKSYTFLQAYTISHLRATHYPEHKSGTSFLECRFLYIYI